MTKVQQLLSVIQAELAASQQMLQLLQHEKQALTGFKSDLVNQVTQQKQALLKEFGMPFRKQRT